MPRRVQVSIGLFAGLLVVLFGVALLVGDDADEGIAEEQDASGASPDGLSADGFSPAVVELVGEFPERESLGDPIAAAAREFGVDVDRYGATVWRESNWRTDVVSSAGAVGPAQLLPATAQEVAVELMGEPDLDVGDPVDNLRMGAALLAELLRRFDGDVLLAHAAYHDGPFSISGQGARPAGLNYALEIEALLDG